MTHLIKSTFIIILLTTIISGAFAQQQNVVFPNFELQQVNGKTWSLSEQIGRPKLIMFWATNCPYCKQLFPVIQLAHEQYKENGLDVIAISVFDKGDVGAYVKENELTMTVLVDGDELATWLSIPGTPTVLILDEHNRIVYGAINPSPFNKEFHETLEKFAIQLAS